ncbi:MAG: S41 family peptidase, partial [Treponema sp.]|nr:S41 family peptidase [Treponema sp.]
EGALPTLTRDGEPAYAFGVFSADDDWSARALSVALENVATGERVSRVVSLSIILSYMADSYPLYEERRENGVPIVVNRTLDGSLIDSVASSSFYRRGADLRDEPVVVLDLRSHRGGFEAPMLNWMDGFGRNSPSGRAFAFFGLLSRSNYMGSDFLPPLWNRVSSRAPIARPSVGNALLVVLMDRNTGSAGDLLIGYLREMENVLFVGTNTRGLLVTREVMRTRLPISGIDFIYGTMLSLRPDFSQFEGVGFLPDLWAPPRESLDRVLAFIERYGLAKYE